MNLWAKFSIGLCIAIGAMCITVTVWMLIERGFGC